MAGSKTPPGVEIIQDIVTTSTDISTPTLLACIIGPGIYIMDPTDSDGDINTDCLAASAYSGAEITLPYPTLLENSDGSVVVEVITSSVKVYFRFGSSSTLTEVASGSFTARDTNTGVTIDAGAGGVVSPVIADVYIGYEALRMDLAPYSGTNLVGTRTGTEIETTDDITTYLGEVDSRNPLALAVYLAKQNAPTTSIMALGVDAVSLQSPQGTSAAYTRALELAETLEVYGLAPLTQEDAILSLFPIHVSAMSAYTAKKERIAILNVEMPDTAADETLASGSHGSKTGNYTFDTAADLTNEGVAAGDTLDVNVGATASYTIASVASGSLFSLQTLTVVSTGSVLDSLLVDAEWSITHPGAALTTRTAIAEAYALIGESYANRRVFITVPEVIEVSIDGIVTEIAGYYYSAIVAGMIGELLPQQPLTNYPIAAIVGLDGSNDYFTPTQLNRMAGGGLFIAVQDGRSTLAKCRHQLSTDVSSTEVQELSITKAIDYYAKTLRIALNPVIGKFNISDKFINTRVTPIISGVSDYMKEEGVIDNYKINSIQQSTTNPDMIVVKIDVTPAYPCNTIRITLEI